MICAIWMEAMSRHHTKALKKLISAPCSAFHLFCGLACWDCFSISHWVRGMSRQARKVLPFRRVPRVALSRYADHSHIQLNFARHHTGDAPDPLPLRLSWLQMAARCLISVPALVIFYLMMAK